MAKISTTPKNISKITEEELQPAFNQQHNKPSAHIIANILNYSRSLEVKASAKGEVMLFHRN
jgi:hypothetical protein